ncbi:MAG: gliding motility-associated C-terminal domain-containing protein, partial [Candidatus Delongbacteria bacterium]|nr:gliding motility-associated C-terminal domain-containing protein [Candidatus Delongbacteria bacterium]
GPDGFTSDVNNPTITSVTTAADGLYSVTITDSYGCTVDDNVDVTVNPTPAANAGSNSPLCVGEDLSLTETGGDASSWSWSGPDSFTSTDHEPVITTVTTAASGTYTVTITGSEGCTNTSSVDVTVNPAPDNPVVDVDCSGGEDNGSITVTVPTGSDYEYDIGSGFQANNVFTSLPNGNYTVTVSNINTGCTAESNPIPLDCGCANSTSLTLSSTSGNACGTATYTVSGNTFGGSATEVYLSHDGNGMLDATTISTSPFDFTYTPDATDAGTNVTITITTNNPLSSPCTVSQENFVLTILSLPEAATFVSSDMSDFCMDDAGTMNLSATGGAGDDIHWYTGSCGDTEIGTGNPLNIETPTTTTTYYARWENSCGVSDCESTTVNVVEPPAAPTSATSDINDFCADDSGNMELSITGGSGETVQWFTGSCGGSSVGSGNPLTLPSPETTTTYYAHWENACGESSCVSHTVNVIDITVPPSDASVNMNELCSNGGNTIELSVPDGAGDALHWYTESCGGTDIGTGNPLEIPQPTTTTTYYARWENTCGQSICQNVTVNIIPASDATINPAGSFCISVSPVVLTAAETGGTWSGAGVEAATGLFDPEAAGTGEHTITYEITGECGATDQIIITVYDNFDATITSDTEYCSDDDTTVLQANTSGGTWQGNGVSATGVFDPDEAGVGDHQVIYSYSGPCGDADTVYFTVYQRADATIYPVDTMYVDEDPVIISVAEPGGTWTGTAIDEDISEFDPGVAGTGSHKVYYTIEQTCGDTDSTNIVVTDAPIEDLLIPDVLTPNYDGYNDTWKIRGVEAFSNVEISIFTRWGDDVYYFNGTGDAYADPSRQWDGTYNDKDMPMGSYVYVLILNNNLEYKGTIIIIR